MRFLVALSVLLLVPAFPAATADACGDQVPLVDVGVAAVFVETNCYETQSGEVYVIQQGSTPAREAYTPPVVIAGEEALAAQGVAVASVPLGGNEPATEGAPAPVVPYAVFLPMTGARVVVRDCSFFSDAGCNEARTFVDRQTTGMTPYLEYGDSPSASGSCNTFVEAGTVVRTQCRGYSEEVPALA